MRVKVDEIAFRFFIQTRCASPSFNLKSTRLSSSASSNGISLSNGTVNGTEPANGTDVDPTMRGLQTSPRVKPNGNVLFDKVQQVSIEDKVEHMSISAKSMKRDKSGGSRGSNGNGNGGHGRKAFEALIVEDNVINQTVLQRQLTKARWICEGESHALPPSPPHPPSLISSPLTPLPLPCPFLFPLPFPPSTPSVTPPSLFPFLLLLLFFLLRPLPAPLLALVFPFPI